MENINILTKKQYPAIDLMKFIMAILVINIHKPFVSYDVPYVNTVAHTALGGCAVPFFFICSAFFVFRKFTDDRRKNNRHFFNFFKRIFILYFLWSAIYLPCNFVKSFTGHYHEITLKLLAGQCIGWTRDFFLSQSFIHFWYLNTLLLSSLLVFLLLKKFSPKTVLIIGLLLFAVSNALYSLNIFDKSISVASFYNSVPTVFKNTLQVGFLCTSLGAYFAMGKHHRPTLRTCVALSASLIAVSIVLSIAITPVKDVAYPLSRFVCIICAYFIFSMCINSNLTPKPIYAKLRAYSSLMYFSHLLLMSEGLRFLANITGIDAFSESYPFAFFLSVFVFLGFAIIITKLQKLKGFGWLRYLY